MKLIGSLPRLLISLLAVTLIVTACSLAGGISTTPKTTQGLIQTIHPATLTAISAASENETTQVPDPLGIPWSDLNGIEIDFWYIWDIDEPGTGLNAIIEHFNRENEWGIGVTPFDQGLTHDPMDSIETAFEEGLVPHVMISDTMSASRWYQAGFTVDLNPYYSDPAAGMDQRDQSNYYSGIFDTYTLSGESAPEFRLPNQSRSSITTRPGQLTLDFLAHQDPYLT